MDEARKRADRWANDGFTSLGIAAVFFWGLGSVVGWMIHVVIAGVCFFFAAKNEVVEDEE